MYPSLFFLLLISCIEGILVKIECPPQCKCDIYEKFRRARCINSKLIVIESNLPNQTQILDLSFNQISLLDDSIFFEQKLLSLKLLNISHNKVSQIHMNAFSGMDQMKTLDLSYNAMQYIIINWFWSLKSLEELYLKENRFGRFSDEPLIESKTLKKLDLSACAITYIGFDAFIKIPNLEYIDISNNYVLQINPIVFKQLQSLQVIKAQGNNITCKEVSNDLESYCITKGIRYEHSCSKEPLLESEKIQRMEMAPMEEETNSWLYETTEDKPSVKIVEICSNNTAKSEMSVIRQVVNLSPTLSLLIPFVYGVAIGILIACTAQNHRRRKHSDENTYISFEEPPRKRTSSMFSRKSAPSEVIQSLVLTEWDNAQTTPMVQRKT